MKPIEELTFTDDYMFGYVMRNEEICKGLLERLLNIKIQRLEFPTLQKTIAPHYESEGVRLDVYVQDLAGSSSVQADASRTPFALDDVGFKPFTIVVVYNVHLLARYQVGRIHQIFIDGDASHVVQIGFGHPCTMNLGLQHFNHHSHSLYLMLSIKRTSPQ